MTEKNLEGITCHYQEKPFYEALFVDQYFCKYKKKCSYQEEQGIVTMCNYEPTKYEVNKWQKKK